MREIQFRLTDKPINIEEISRRVNENPNQFSNSTLTRLRGVFDNETGILGRGNVSLRRTKRGYYIIEYAKSEKSISSKQEIKSRMIGDLKKGAPSLEEQKKFAGEKNYQEQEQEKDINDILGR